MSEHPSEVLTDHSSSSLLASAHYQRDDLETKLLRYQNYLRQAHAFCANLRIKNLLSKLQVQREVDSLLQDFRDETVKVLSQLARRETVKSLGPRGVIDVSGFTGKDEW